MKMTNRSLYGCERRGVAVVEFAVVAPILFLVVFGSIEFCRALMAVQSLEESARAGCRVAILRGATSEEIEAEVDRILAPSGIPKENYTVQTDPTNIATVERWSLVSVTVVASFDDMSWLPLPGALSGKSYTSSCSLPKEYSSGG